MREIDFIQRVSEAGGSVYIVGGWVRDCLRGVIPHDKDYVVTGLTEDVFCGIIPETLKTGKNFPVYRLEIDGAVCDAALARSETKSGRGYRGFDASFSPETSLEEDLYRRDTTINAMALDARSGALIDPYGGRRDLRDGVIRAVSEHFAADPVRALRAARQSAQFGYMIEPRTTLMMSECRDELREEPGERVVNELALALACERPSVFFTNLMAAGLLDVTFPRLYELAGTANPDGDGAFARAMGVVDKTAELSGRAEIRFAALAGELGNGPESGRARPDAEGDASGGVEALMEWNRRSALPRLWVKIGLFVIRERARVSRMERPEDVVDLLERMERNPIGAGGFDAIAEGCRWDLPEILKNRGILLKAIKSIKAADSPPELAGKAIGDWLRARRADAVAEIMKRGPSRV
jgi:tRNA nucleotidyltransferase (CCA-adding enzyme)